MGRSLFEFFRREDGVVAVIFAVMAIPFIAMAGWAVDYVRIQHVKEYLQAQVDGAALSATMHLDGNVGTWAERESAQWQRVEAVVRGEIARTYQGDWANDPQISREWLEREIDVKVTASAYVPLAFINILPGIPDTQLVEVSAIARVNNVVWDYDIEIADLDYDAGDYNRVWAYCFWPNRPEHNGLPRRTQMVPIADNGGPANKRNVYNKDNGSPILDGADSIEDAQLKSMYLDAVDDDIHGLDGREKGIYRTVSGAGTGSRTYAYIAPLCQGDSYLSFRLENVRFARTSHQYWEEGDSLYNRGGPANNSGDKHFGRYDYYTDTYRDAGSDTEQYSGLSHPRNGSSADVLETVLCNTLAECKTRDKGGVIPTGTGRAEGTANERQRATEDCSPGKYMYYGWEDRPPGQPGKANDWTYEAWTDADFDDIRVVLKCPELKQYGDRNARLIG